MINPKLIKASVIEKDLERAYADSLRLQKKIENELKRIPERKSVRITAKARENLEKLANCEVDYTLTRKEHAVGYASNIPTQNLIDIMQNGNSKKKVPARPFIERFKQRLKIDFPSGREMNTLDFSTIKKNIEDSMDAQFARAMNNNELRLKGLKYRNGIPLNRSGKLIKSIRWKLVEK